MLKEQVSTLAWIVPLVLVSSLAAAQGVTSNESAGNFERCAQNVQNSFGGTSTHMEFESRDGVPMYEFVVEADSGDKLYVGCVAASGILATVDVIVEEGDPRFPNGITEDDAAAAALQRYSGAVEEVKRLLLEDGSAVYEVDVEAEPNAEYNVYVDAETGTVKSVNMEYLEIGANTGDTPADPAGTASGGSGN